jgi:hypothetical protein
MSKTKKIEDKEYLVTVPVIATGHQIFSSRAPNKEAAIDKVAAGGGAFVEESFDVQSFKIDQAKAEENK